MSVYHFYASGFGLIRELLHRGIHLSFVLGHVFLLFATGKSNQAVHTKAWYRFDGVPLVDLVLSVLAVVAALYLPLFPPIALAQRVGNPSPFDIFMGSSLLLLTLEATRRNVGRTLPIIGLFLLALPILVPGCPVL
jgi:TRAP-type uncharacterized transport system fused permease subunit